MRRRSARDGGFSLLESLLAILILGVGIVGILEGVTAALRTSKDAERHTVAVLLASGRLEEIRAEGLLTEGERDVDPDGIPPAYSLRETVARTPTDGLYEVTVTVELAETSQVVHELKTLIFEPTAASLAFDGGATAPSPRRKAKP
jgi:prepilin-type N-terminal cleavage/methylation domain-containing protein